MDKFMSSQEMAEYLGCLSGHLQLQKAIDQPVVNRGVGLLDPFPQRYKPHGPDPHK